MYNKKLIKFAQEQLSQRGPVSLVADGIAGPATINALALIPTISSNWSAAKMVVGYVQHVCHEEGIEAGPIDGLLGPQTEYAYGQLVHKLAGNDKASWFWRDDEGIGGEMESGVEWPLQVQSELVKF